MVWPLPAATAALLTFGGAFGNVADQARDVVGALTEMEGVLERIQSGGEKRSDW